MNIEQMLHYKIKLSYEIDSFDLYECIMNKDDIVILDARSFEAYKKEHIPFAINLWHKDISSGTTENFDKDKTYICYCDGIGCNASTKAALSLLKLGFEVKELIGGLDWWKRDGYTTDENKINEDKISCSC